jgi:hypothetical protein
MTLSIVDFLNARLKDDADTAEAARDLMDEPWKILPEGPEEENYSGEYRISNGITVAGHVEEAKAAFIARHDPARVLREVEAKRTIVDLHGRKHECSTFDHNGDIDSCSYCSSPEDCSTLLALASIYSDHPGYQEEWAPIATG